MELNSTNGGIGNAIGFFPFKPRSLTQAMQPHGRSRVDCIRGKILVFVNRPLEEELRKYPPHTPFVISHISSQYPECRRPNRWPTGRRALNPADCCPFIVKGTPTGEPRVGRVPELSVHGPLLRVRGADRRSERRTPHRSIWRLQSRLVCVNVFWSP